MRFAALLVSVSVWAGPAISFATMLRDDFTPLAIASDGAGNAYILGADRVVKMSSDGRHYLYERRIEGTAKAIAVDRAGNAFITGGLNRRAFVTKLSPEGEPSFSRQIGGDFISEGLAILLTADGEIVVSGTSEGGFPTTDGAFKPATTPPLFLTKLDESATRTVFAIYGIGGSSLATDPAGNIYVAGSTTRFDYPTTPGAYQERFRNALLCLTNGCFGAQKNQYVSKIDVEGSALIYSTALTWHGTTPIRECESFICFPVGSSFTDHRSLAVDQEGNAYVTGLSASGYPFTIIGPVPAGVPYLTKLNAAGTGVVFSTPIGGQSVSITPDGAVFAIGTFAAQTFFRGSVTRNAVPFGFDNDGPYDCFATGDHAYISHVDRESGHVLSTRRMDGSLLTATGAATALGSIWLAGYSASNALLISADAPMATRVERGPMLARYEFETDAKISCLSRLPFQRLGAVAVGELVRIWGKDFPLGAITVTVDGLQAIVEAAGQTTIDFRVPSVSRAPYATVRVFSDGLEIASAKIALGA